MTAETLSSAIRNAATNRDIRRRAGDLSERIRREDGVGTAWALIEKIA